MSTNSFTRIAVLATAVAALSLGSAAALAHTSIKQQAYEGRTEDNALKIGHGCERPDGTIAPVIAQSVVFPVLSPQLTTSDGSTIDSLAEVIAPASLAGLVDTIQDRSIFGLQGERTDRLGNLTGFWARNGALGIHRRGRVPFQFTAPAFVADSCAARLLIKVAIADICDVSAPAVLPGKVNLWIPDNGSQFAVEGAAQGIDGIGAAATLTLNRDLVANPITNPACGAGIDVTVTPSPEEVDARLPIPRYWSR